MSLSFVIPEINIGGAGVPTLRFYKKGFVLNGTSGVSPSWRDVILSGNTALTLVNAKEDGLNYLKLFGGTEQLPETYLDTVTLSGGCEQRNLPAEYTQVEYLESSGTQYIDTGIVLKSVATITTVAQANTFSYSGPYSFWGFMSGNNNLPRWGWSTYQNRWLPDLNTTTQNLTLADTNKHTFINTCYYNNNVLQYDSLLDGNSIVGKNVENPAAYTSNTLSAYLFARNNWVTAGNFLACRIYSFNIVQDDIEVINLIPCRRNSDSVLGMFDLISQTFLTNAGTGDFTAGSDVVPTPDTPMDIVCNNGVVKYSKNLYNMVSNPIEQGTLASGVPSDSDYRVRTSDYINVVTGSTYTVSTNVAYIFVWGFSSSNTPTNISNGWMTGSGYTFTVPSDIVKLKLVFAKSTGVTEKIAPSDVSWVMLEQGSTATAYTPYSPNGIYTDGTQEVVTDSVGNTASAEMLLSIGDYKDTQEVISGAITRNVGIIVLNGSENWAYSSISDDMARIYKSSQMPSENDVALCTHGDISLISRRAAANYPNTWQYGIVSNAGYLGFKCYKSDFANATDFTKWLSDQYNAGTPVTILYPLETATTETVSGQFLSKSPVTQTAGSISNLPIAETSSSHTTPTPQQPLQINCNNGVVKYNNNIVDNTITGQGTFVSPGASSATRIYKYFGKLPSGDYTISVTGGFQFIVQYRDADPPVAGMTYGNIDTWTTSGTYTLDNPDYFYGIAIRYPDDSNITPSDFNGTIALKPQFVNTDGTVETVEVTGKNLFNKDDDTNWGGWYPTAGVIATANSNRTLVMRCQPNTTYYFKHCTYVGGLRVFYTEVENWEIGSPYASSSGAVRDEANVVYNITTSANAKWLFVSFGRRDATITATFEEQASDYILSTEELTSATPYEPYYNGGSATAEMLLKVGDYQDEQSVIDGGVTRNVGVKVFNGTENWSTGSASNPNRYTLAAAFNDLADLIDNNIGYSNCYTVISKSTSIQSSLQNNECGWNTTKVFCVRDDRIATLADWKQFLADQYNAGFPVIVVYPLAEPTTETVTGQPLTTQAGTNIVSITQASIENLGLEVSYKATT